MLNADLPANPESKAVHCSLTLRSCSNTVRLPYFSKIKGLTCSTYFSLEIQVRILAISLTKYVDVQENLPSNGVDWDRIMSCINTRIQLGNLGLRSMLFLSEGVSHLGCEKAKINCLQCHPETESGVLPKARSDGGGGCSSSSRIQKCLKAFPPWQEIISGQGFSTLFFTFSCCWSASCFMAGR